MFVGTASVHNCYGTGHQGCGVYGVPVTDTIRANNQ